MTWADYNFIQEFKETFILIVLAFVILIIMWRGK